MWKVLISSNPQWPAQVQSDDRRSFQNVGLQLSTNLNNNCHGRLMVGGRPIVQVLTSLRRNRCSHQLYTPAQRQRRDASPWTLVQGILAPLQFAIFFVSLCLVLRFLATGEGLAAATASVVIKTLALYAIMITGSI